MDKTIIVKRLVENKQITSEEADLLLNKKEEIINIKDKYVSKQEFTKAIKEIKDLIELIVQNPRDQDKLNEEVKEDLISQKDKILISFLPYLIAFPLEKTLEEEHAWTKINLLKDTLLNYLKFLGLITASEFFNSPLKDRNIISSFYKNLSSPSFGSWNAFIRETLQFLNENNHDFFCPELKEYYVKVETGKKRKLYNVEIEIIDAKGDIEIKKQQATAIGMLINFRNRYLGHGLTLDKPKSEKLWEKYYPIFRNLLMGLDWCNDYIIYKNEGKNTWKLQSASINQVEVLKAKDNIWLQNKEGEKMDLFPFFIVPGEVALADHDTKLLAYESYTGKSIKFFSPEGIDKTTSGRVLERLNLIIKDKQEEKPYLPAEFTADILKDRIEKENQFVLQTLIDERKVIKGIYQSREDIEVKLRSWVGGMANVFFIAAEAGSGKTNLLVEIQRQYKEREFNSLLIRACRMAKRTLKDEIAYLLNIEPKKELMDYKVLNQTQKEPLFILIDGINESQDEQDIWKEVKEISKTFDPGVIKFVVSCRVNGKKDLDRFILVDNKDILYTESKDEVKQLSDAVFWLTPLNMVELEGVWNTYTSKNKKTTNPQFKFNDIADYDRSIYEKIKNPLILRIFLETYHNKPLPKKGKKKLHIWRDWFKTFREEEKTLLKLLAKKVWEKDNNELELEELLNDAELESFIIEDKVNAPFSRLIGLGWLSRFNKDNVIIISFTVEGLLFYLLALYLNDNIKIDVKQIVKWLNKDSVIKKSAVESYLIECAEKDDVELITDLIDHGEKTLELTIPSLTEYAKTHGAKKTIEVLFENPTDFDWLALKELLWKLYSLQHQELNGELLLASYNHNNLETLNQIYIGQYTLYALNFNEKSTFLSKIEKAYNAIDKDYFQDEKYSIISLNLAEYYYNTAEYKKAIIFCKKFIKTTNDLALVTSSYHRIGLCYRNIGMDEEDKTYHNKALKNNIKLFGNKHINTANAYNSLGVSFLQSKDNHKSIEYFERSIEITNELYGEKHVDNITFYQNLSIAWNNLYILGDAASTFSSFDEDASSFYKKSRFYDEKSLEIIKVNYGEKHTLISDYYLNLGQKEAEIGDHQKAIESYELALPISVACLGEFHIDVSVIYHNLGISFRNLKMFDESIKSYNKSLEIKLKNYGEIHPEIAVSYYNIGKVYESQIQDDAIESQNWDDNSNLHYDKAIKYIEKSLQISNQIYESNHQSKFICNKSLSTLYLQKENLKEAISHIQSCFLYLKSSHSDLESIITFKSSDLFTIYKGYLLSYDYNYSKVDLFLDTLIKTNEKIVSKEFSGFWESMPKEYKPYLLITSLDHSIDIINHFIENEQYEYAVKYSKNEYDFCLENFGGDNEYTLNFLLLIVESYISEEMYGEAIKLLNIGFEFDKNAGGFPARLGICYEKIGDLERALQNYILSAELRNSSDEKDKEQVKEVLIESISNSIRIAKSLNVYENLPKWIKEFNGK